MTRILFRFPSQFELPGFYCRTLFPKMWAAYCPSKGCKKFTFGWRASLKTGVTMKMLNPFYQALPAFLNTFTQIVVFPVLLLTWSPKSALQALEFINGFPLTGVFIPPAFPSFKYLPCNIFSDLHNSSTSHLHITRKMLSGYSAIHVLLKGH